MRSFAVMGFLLPFLPALVPTAGAVTNLKQYIVNGGFKATYSHLDAQHGKCVGCTRYSDHECCWNGSRCITPAPPLCGPPNQDWWRWQFSGTDDQAYDVFYSDGSRAPLIRYSATYADCGIGYNVNGSGCGSAYNLANSIVFAPVTVDEACGASPYGDGAACPAGNGRTPVHYADRHGAICNGIANYSWNVVPGGAAAGRNAAGVNDTYSTASDDIDHSRPVVHIRWVISNTWSSGKCSGGTDYEDWWFGTTAHGVKAPLITFGGPGVFVPSPGHWWWLINN
jgi:hypothetical protein